MKKILLIGLPIVFGLIVTLVMYGFRRVFSSNQKKQEIHEGEDIFKLYPFNQRLSIYNGILEIFLFSVCFIIDIPTFIAFWIGMKVALGWKLEFKDMTSQKQSRQDYNQIKFFYFRFLIGNALNIILGYLIYIIITEKKICF